MNKSQAGQENIYWIENQAGLQEVCRIEGQAGLDEKCFKIEGQAGIEKGCRIESQAGLEGFRLDGQVGHEGCNNDNLSKQEVVDSDIEILSGNEEGYRIEGQSRQEVEEFKIDSPTRQEVEESDLEHEQSRLDTTCSELKNSDSIVLSSMPSRILMILSMMLILHAMMLHL